MNLKQLIFIIQLVVIIKNTQCYAKDRHDISTPNVSKSNKKISNGNFLNDFYNVREISNCSYEHTINIAKEAILANGSYIYHNETLVPPQLVGNYDYEILYNGTRRKVAPHKRACICQLKSCITLCSNDISEAYRHIINNGLLDFIDVFSIEMTFTNSGVAMKNIVEDFEPIVLKEFCAASYMLSPEEDVRLSWTLFENGTLLRHSDQMQLKRTEYCFDLHRATIDNVEYDLINPRVCAAIKSLAPVAKFNYCVQLFSIMLLILIMIVHCCLPQLLTVQGKCFLTYVICLAISFGIYSFINLSQITQHTVPCLLMAYLNYYFQLSHYIWLGIICFHNWRSFGNSGHIVSYFTYAWFGYLFPFLMTLLTAGAHNVNIQESWKPSILEGRCGLDVHKWAVFIYLYGPCLIILVYCLITFILSSVIIILAIKMNNKQNEASTVSRTAGCTLYFHFVMMVLCWFFDVLSYIFNLLDSPAVVNYITAIQALFIVVYFFIRNVRRKNASGQLKCASVETTI